MLIASVGLMAAGCSSSSGSTEPGPANQGTGNGSSSGENNTSGGTSSNGASSGSSGSPGSSSASTDPGSSSSGTSSGTAPTGDDSGGDATAPSSTDDGGASAAPDSGTTTTPPAACTKGQVTPQQVVMLGDSYLDPNYGNVGPNIVADAQMAGALAAGVKYREYYLAGAAMNNGALNLNIPYQYETTAKGDLSVANPKDIQLVIMDGGGNDVLIDQQSCLTDATSAAQMADMACMNAVSNTVARTKKLWQEMATDGVKQIVYFFYPHLDPAGGGLLPATGAPGVNLIDDYSAPLYQQICCGSSFTPTTTAYTCSGNAPGTKCVYIDTRPAFTGHTGAAGEPGPDWILSDHVHPNAMGSVVIANLVWDTMVANCIGQ